LVHDLEYCVDRVVNVILWMLLRSTYRLLRLHTILYFTNDRPLYQGGTAVVSRALESHTTHIHDIRCRVLMTPTSCSLIAVVDLFCLLIDDTVLFDISIKLRPTVFKTFHNEALLRNELFHLRFALARFRGTK